ncbi:MAG: NUDIX domain-containing protein [Hyphomicrobiales bacterium]|nr:NUDIX domain-containing protein [Hyphomicrobiales bacterium]
MTSREKKQALGDVDPVIPAIGADGSLFAMGKLEVHRRGQHHVAVSVFIFAGDRLLIQQRADGKYHSGGLWANACCTHPHWGESAEHCASRRLREELGLKATLYPCAVVDYFADVGNGLVENERVHIFRGDLHKQIEVASFNRDEVQAVAWLSERELRREAASDPDRFTPWLRIYLDRWSELSLRPAA